MFHFFKFLLIGVGLVIVLAGFALSCVVLLFFPEWVRWTAGIITALALLWFIFFGRFRRKSGLLINDGTVYDRWRSATKVKGDFL